MGHEDPIRKTVLITDYAWPDTEVERIVIDTAGYKLVTGPATPAPSEVIEALVQTHQPVGMLTCWAPVSTSAVAASRCLKVVGRLGVGLDNIAVEECTKRGIWVTNVPDYCVEEVSDHAVGFLLAWTRGLVILDRAVHEGRWEPAKASLRRLSAITCGVVGYGHIGRATVRKLSALGCKVLVNTARPHPEADGINFVSLDILLAKSDCVILHMPLNALTNHFMDHKRLAQMKPGGLLINVSRGGLVDNRALAEALKSGHLNAAGLDVLDGEPVVPDALLNHPRVMLTPHVAFSSDASLSELRQRAAEEIVRVLHGELPRHPCNEPRPARSTC